MKIGWNSAEMKHLCVSRHGLRRSATVHADDLRLLLSLVSAAQDLTDLDTFNSVTMTATDTSVSLRLGAAEIEGRLIRSPSGYRSGSPKQEVSEGLFVQHIWIGGQALMRAAG